MSFPCSWKPVVRIKPADSACRGVQPLNDRFKMPKGLSHLSTRAMLRFFEITANHIKNLAGSFLVVVPAGKPLANVPIIDSTRSARLREARQLRATGRLPHFVRRGIEVVQGNQDISKCALAGDANGNRRGGFAVQNCLQVVPGSKQILDRGPHILNLSPISALRKIWSDQQRLFVAERFFNSDSMVTPRSTANTIERPRATRTC